MSGVDVSERDRQILSTVADLRVASTRQLERLHFPPHESGSAVSAARRSRRVLERLARDRLLDRLERRIGGVRAGSASWLYRLGPAGLRVLGLPGRAGWREPSRWFVDHLLAIGDVHVEVQTAVFVGEIQSAEICHEPDCWRRFLAPHGGTETLKPDAQINAVTGSDELRWWIEVDRATEGLPTIVRKAQVYERYWRSGAESSISDIFPRVLWLVPHERRRAALIEALHGQGGVTEQLHVVALQADATDAITEANVNQPHLKGGES